MHMKRGELDERLMHIWKAGSRGFISEEEVKKSIRELLQIEQEQVEALMADLWEEYLGTPNTELITYFASLRLRYKTALLSNSFVGARSKEQERYHFMDICDLIIYSHEERVAKPDRRIFEVLCERLDVQPAEIIFLDDVAGHVAAARELGIHAILFKGGYRGYSGLLTSPFVFLSCVK